MSKTKNHSVRFDEENFKFACKRIGVESGQKLVDFLLSEYCKLYRVENKSVFATKENAGSYDGEKNNTLKLDEVGQHQETNYVAHEESQIEAWKKDMQSCEDRYELERIVSLMKKDTELKWSEKNELERFGLQTYKQKGFDEL
jgi:hypothetical protein